MIDKQNNGSRICPKCQGRKRELRWDTTEVVFDDCNVCHGRGELQSGRIDVIRRHAPIAKVFGFSLARLGYDVRTFTDIDAYLDQLGSPPDCIVAGFIFERDYVNRLFAELANRGIDTPIIVCTVLDISLDSLPAEIYALFTGLGCTGVFKELEEAIKRAVLGLSKDAPS
jgi:hypothetical protein